MTDTHQSMGDGLDFVTTVHRPGLPDVHLGFRFQHQAEHASWSLTSDLTNTTHVVGTTISWRSRPRGVAVLPPVPADAGLIAELIRQEDYHGDPEQFPDLHSRLKAQEGFERPVKYGHLHAPGSITTTWSRRLRSLRWTRSVRRSRFWPPLIVTA